MMADNRRVERSRRSRSRESYFPHCPRAKVLFLHGLMAKGIGETQTSFLNVGSPEEPFVFSSGAKLPGITVAYETYGKLNARKNNAILLFHALSGSQHAAGVTKAVPGTDARWTEDCQMGWWDLFIGPGKALDTNRYFVICANYLGGCYGSSGPASINPKTGQPYGSKFPAVSTSDVVRSQLAAAGRSGHQATARGHRRVRRRAARHQFRDDVSRAREDRDAHRLAARAPRCWRG